MTFGHWQWNRLATVGIATVAAVLLLQVGLLYAIVLWGDFNATGLRYYGRPHGERATFRRRLQWWGIALSPVIWLLSRIVSLTFRKVSFSYEGVAGPSGICSVESFRLARAYEPTPQDVFVVTQMKCGTTWMQHVVYQVLCRGAGNLVETGTALYAVSPWLESLKTVSVTEAPLVGAEKASRIIKTHLPAQLCPYSAEAKYIYVVRHPLSCFASCADFIASNLGAFAPPVDNVEAWFRSELMWWGTWPAHVRGWWELSQHRPNIHFVSFEEMREDLNATVLQVAELLEVRDLTDAELADITHKCSFEYMREHSDSFEMNPPHVLQKHPRFFVSGAVDRYNDASGAIRQRILSWCKSEMIGSEFPLDRFYPDVAAAGETNLAGLRTL